MANYSILLVDSDNDYAAELFNFISETQDFTVQFAKSFLEAEKILERSHIDLMVTDTLFNDTETDLMDGDMLLDSRITTDPALKYIRPLGIALAKFVSSKTPSTKVIIYTGGNLEKMPRYLLTERNIIFRQKLNNSLSQLAEEIDNLINSRNPVLSAQSESSESTRSLGFDKTLAELPPQDSLVQFKVSDQQKLQLAPSVFGGNDNETILALREELLASGGSIDLLLERFGKATNIPQAKLFGPIISNYKKELSKDLVDINFAVLYARGSRVYSARANSEKQVVAGEWPELDADEMEAINNICDLHGPLIMASSVGARIVTNAHQFEATADTYRREQETIRELGLAIASEPKIVEQESADNIVAIASPPEPDIQPERTRGLGLAIASSGLVALVGGSALFATGSAGMIITLPLALGTAYGWEVIKKTERFKSSTTSDAEKVDQAIAQVQGQVGVERDLLKNISDFVDKKAELFGRVADLRPEFSWAKKYIPKTTKNSPNSDSNSKNDEEDNFVFIPFTSPPKALAAYLLSFDFADEITRDQWHKEISSSRVIADLKKLGLIEYPSPNTIKLSNKDVFDPQAMFKYAVSQQASIQITREALINNPSAVAGDICALITARQGKEFNTYTTKLRVGNALMRWARWLEPHLISPSDSRSTILTATATSKVGAKGRARLKTPENLNIVSETILGGGTRQDAAKKIRATAGAISNWISEGIVPGVPSNFTGSKPQTLENHKIATEMLQEGKSYEEVSDITGVQVSTIKGWLRKGKIKLN